MRALGRMPLLVGGVVLTLAVAVGLNVAMFGLIDRAFLSPPARVAEPARVFTLAFGVPGANQPHGSMSSTSWVAFRAIREGVPAIAGAAAFQRTPATLMIDGDQRNVKGMLVSGDYFAVLGTSPLLGRALNPADDEAGAALPAVVLGHGFWRNGLQEDSGIVGQRIVIGGLEHEVVGVMPEGFSGHSTESVDVWIPLSVAMRGDPGWDGDAFRNVAAVVVRLAPGQTPAAAVVQAGSVMERPVSLKAIAGSDVPSTERNTALWLGGVAALVFLTGLANAAILLVVRGLRTRHVMAIRAALGASRARLRTQVVIEAGLIALAATGTSLILASWMDEAVRLILFPELSGRSAGSLAAVGTAGLAGLVAALVAALAGVSQIPSDSQPTHPGLLRSGVSGRHGTIRSLLLVQTTLAVLLLAGAGFFAASLYRLRGQDFGMDLGRAIVVDFEHTSADLDGQDQFFTEALARVRTLPGVQTATVTDSIPFAGHNVPPISVPGRAEPPAVGQQLPFLTAATPEFLAILGVKVLEGRPFNSGDDRGAPVVLVNQTMARMVWPGESAVGKCIRIGFDPGFDPSTFDPSSGPPMPSAAVPCREVIGVTRDVRQRSVLPFDGEDRLMQYFVPFSQAPDPPFAPNPTRIRGLLLSVDERLPPPAVAIRRAVLGGRTDLPYLRVRPYSELLERQMRPWTRGTRLLSLFSALALLVAAVGMFAAFAHAVAERRREMAIRIAIGARPAAVRSMVLREALIVASGGGVIGSLLAVLAGQGMRSLLFGTEPSDPVVLLASSTLMLLIAAAATFLPAREAAKADPSVLLRAE